MVVSGMEATLQSGHSYVTYMCIKFHKFLLKCSLFCIYVCSLKDNLFFPLTVEAPKGPSDLPGCKIPYGLAGPCDQLPTVLSLASRTFGDIPTYSSF